MRRALLLLSLAACGSLTSSPGAGADTDGTGASGGSPITSSDAGDAGAACPTAVAVETLAPLKSAAITEPSGLAASKSSPGVFWTHNDSGDSARAFAVDRMGTLLLTLVFDTAPAVDIEDMAIEDAADGGSFLYFGDIGDNSSGRRDVVIHRVREPAIAAGITGANLTATSEKMTVQYADGPHNAETLLFDPVRKELFIATKVLFGSSAVHRVGPFVAGSTVTTSRIAGVPVALATGGAISRDGALIAIRNYSKLASVWRRAPGEDLATALARAACKVPISAETQGEAFAFLPDTSGYVTVSEGAGASLHVTQFR